MNLSDLARSLGSTRAFARVGRAASRLDRRIQRATDGRWSVLGRARLPQLVLTTTGRRTGEPRDAVLLYGRDGTAWVVLASNWGQGHDPAWALNLLAEPHASVTVGGVTTRVVARPASDDERVRLLPRMREIWPGYEAYAERAGRSLPLFVLEPRLDPRS
ncbi:nitroreductase family deazaflavin-dependent oxidoreductase [Cellulomonas sp. DKR-3]|uniref:Nitroreductase family deazaflavin-dependent oxidoreductase n=1 Tax=Cellulomonas fulva TaxID=2835530 RepID=A0ABS5TUK8_9CELL|nr:nitroreductase/quinone reductase family protein [Cellulomonas fulva]MBT0992811.1 nitroreductase family deazaflavin-dependent oxidoreductase [Cellulomonas fulva]